MDSNVSDFVLFIGRFHPLVVHFPIGFLFFAFILEIFSRWSKNSALISAIPLALFSGAVSGLIACVLGYMLSLNGDYEEGMLNTHFWFGIATTAVAFFAWLIRIEKIKIPFYRINSNISTLTLIIILLGITGHYGGNLTHGSDYLVKYAPFGKAKKIPLPPISKVEDAVVFDYLVNPILENKCTSCHNSSKKKGGLSLQDGLAILKGGKNGAVFIAGDASKSEMIRRVMLNPHNEDFMPPEGKIPLTDEEVAILTYWIDNTNADFNVTLGSVETPENIVGIASSILGIEDATGKSGIPLPTVKKVSEDALNDLIAEGFKVRELIFESNLYEVALPAKTITPTNLDKLDGKLQKLNSIKENIVWLSLKDNFLQDKHIKAISQFINLQKLNIDQNPVTDVGVAEIKNNGNITGLNLYQTKITKTSLETFSKMKSLKRVYVWGTAITKKDIAPYTAKEDFPNIILGL